MSNKYDFASVEPKWQKYWEEHGSFRAKAPTAEFTTVGR